ncbi:MAG: hydroxyproline-2-epimerase [Rhodoferax sp.]|nr:hydroxyproline-2-epimerase [Rhodoferax sp.]
MKRIQVIDSHTGGEPTRLVIGGFPELGHGSMAERRALLAAEHDAWRAATVLEPRGSDVVVGALLCEPVSPDAAAGVIFFNNTGYLGMCGHGTIGLVATLAHMGRITQGEHRIETPVGTVTATLHADGAVSVRNLPAYRHLHQVAVEVPGHGTVRGDVAYGGNWFFLVNDHGQRLASDNLPALTAYTSLLREALAAQGVTGRDGAEIDHIEIFAEGTERFATGERSPMAGAAASTGNTYHSKNFVLCPGLAYDRSPCGTGTSAKIACLAADGKLAPGEIWRQASVIGSVFEASYTLEDGQVVPTIRGRAHLSAEATLLIEDDDPFGWGIRL